MLDLVPRRGDIGLLLLFAALIVSGCGSDESGGSSSASSSGSTTSATQAVSKAAPGFTDYEDLDAGKTYTTTQQTPKMSLKVPPGTWNTESGDRADGFAVAADQTPAVPQAILAVHHISKVFDPERGGRRPGDQIPLRGDFAAWLSSHPHLQTTKPKPVRLLGLKGVELDVTGRSSPPRIPEDCGAVGDGCVPLFHDGFDYVFYAKGNKGRFDVLELPAGGQLVVERFAEPAKAFGRALNKLKPLLAGLSVDS